MNIELKKITKKYPTGKALKDVSLSIIPGELLTILGPSGSGKTTLLRILAGIEKEYDGSISYPQTWLGRNILVFQDYLLFPHLNVFDNIAFGLRAARIKKHELKSRVERYLEIFHIEDKAFSYPQQLSGGQKQRVAIARAMVLEPSLLLLDEPFANLDRQLKLETAHFIRSIQRELGTTTLCVTHDLDEAFIMSDRIGILIDGNLHQIGSRRKVYFEPRTREAAELLGPVNPVPFEICREVGWPIDSSDSQDCYYLRKEALRLSPSPKGSGAIIDKDFSGMIINYKVDYKGIILTIASLEDAFDIGERVNVTISQRFLDRKLFLTENREAI
jgi:putative spermidine/putrescine transport system ATP-binding protein